MSISLDKVFGIHAKALSFRAERAEVLAQNLANAETPGYKARDLDFSKALSDIQSQTGLMQRHQKHLSSPGYQSGAEVIYREIEQERFDQNTVDTQVEYAEYSKNALQYQSSLQFLKGNIKSVLTAIRGQ